MLDNRDAAQGNTVCWSSRLATAAGSRLRLGEESLWNYCIPTCRPLSQPQACKLLCLAMQGGFYPGFREI